MIGKGLVRAFAAMRAARSNHISSTNIMSEDHYMVGAAGEAEFSVRYGFPWDRRHKPEGDDGIDFMVPILTSLDVKTARIPKELWVNVKTAYRSGIYVLAGYSDETETAELLGWAWREEVLVAPSQTTSGGPVVHYIPRAELRKMAELEELMGRVLPVSIDHKYTEPESDEYRVTG